MRFDGGTVTSGDTVVFLPAGSADCIHAAQYMDSPQGGVVGPENRVRVTLPSAGDYKLCISRVPNPTLSDDFVYTSNFVVKVHVAPAPPPPPPPVPSPVAAVPPPTAVVSPPTAVAPASALPPSALSPTGAVVSLPTAVAPASALPPSAPSPRASSSYIVSGENSLGMILLKALGVLAGIGGFLFGVVSFYARRKSMRRQEQLLEDARQQQQQMRLHQEQMRQDMQRQMTNQFGQLLSALDVAPKDEIEMQTPSSRSACREADETTESAQGGASVR